MVFVATDKDQDKILVSHINIRQSISILVSKLILLDMIGVLALVALYYPELYPSIFLPNTINVTVFFLAAIAKILLTVYLVLAWLNEYWEITTKMVVHKRGIIFRKEEKFQLERVRSVGVAQGIFGRIFNCGTLTLYDLRLIKYVDLYLIHSPMRYLHVLEDMIPNLEERKSIIREHLLEAEE